MTQKNFVSVFGVTVGGSIANLFNGVFQIGSIGSGRTTFTYQMQDQPAAGPDGSGSGAKCAKQLGTPLQREQSIATFHTLYPHFFLKDDAVEVRGAFKADGEQATEFTGDFTIKSTGPPTGAHDSVIYEMTNSPQQNAFGAPFIYEFWQIGQMLVENNVIELAAASSSVFPVAFNLFGGAQTSPYIYKEFLFRGNVVCPFGQATEFFYIADAVRTSSVRRGLVDENLISLPSPGRLRHDASEVVRYFDNQKPDGALVRGLEGDAETAQDELATQIEDSMMMAFL